MTMRYVAPAAPPDLVPVAAPTFSIVIPAYQAAWCIANAVESALAQSTSPYEIIVCNDGSTDDLEHALAPYAAQLVIINKVNGGEASAKNAGIRAARSDFVAFLDADDVFLPSRIEALSQLASRRPDLDILTTDAYLVVNGERVRRCYTEDFPFPRCDQRSAILRYNFLPFAAVRRSAALEVEGFDESLRNVPDWDLWLRMILDGARSGFVDEPLAEYRLSTMNVTSDRARVHRGKFETLQKTLDRRDLSEDERQIVQRGLDAERQQLALCIARDLLRSRSPGARRACVRVLSTRAVGLQARATALAAALAPGVASRLLHRRERRSGKEIGAGLHVPAKGE